jgi:hypothetical protein
MIRASKPAAKPNSLCPARLRLYHPFMPPSPKPRPRPVWRLLLEVAFIVFLFYSNLLMGEFNAAAGKGKTLAFALHDIFTAANFAIALISSLTGFLVFEFLRKKL